MADGEILEILQKRIESELKRKRLAVTSRAQLEILQLFVIYLQDDHKKVEMMWATFKPVAWGMGIFAATVIAMLASGRFTWIIK